MTKTFEPSNLLTFQPSFYPSNLPAFQEKLKNTLNTESVYKWEKLFSPISGHFLPFLRYLSFLLSTFQPSNTFSFISRPKSVQKWENTFSPISRHKNKQKRDIQTYTSPLYIYISSRSSRLSETFFTT